MKKNAFTLIELLAVILILGIISLIAIPIINKLLDDAKKGSFESSLNNIEKKINEICNEEILKGNEITDIYTITNETIFPVIDLKGKLPNGVITVDNKCNTMYQLSNNTYTGSKNYLDIKPIITKGNSANYIYTEDALNGADPKLDKGMIPVIIDNNGIVKKANIYTQWYKYDDKDNINDNSMWANAILVNNDTRSKYKNAKADTLINLEDIQAYLVWIPRYKYTIPLISDNNNPPLINIKFENKNSLKSKGNAIDNNYFTHPAFTFNNKELDGIWVAKFETTGTDNNPTSLPNISSLRNQKLSLQFETAKKFNQYGISNISHMMKNSEWGAVAYLSHSKYGSSNQIRVNNNSDYVTGCGSNTDNAAKTISCDIKYGNALSYPQSTTGNITGIFDMSGGSYERVMTNYKLKLSDSGFIQMPESEYYDLYNTDNYETACNENLCKGHANYETKNWYEDYYYVTNSSNPWVDRGGFYDGKNGTGIFQINTGSGINHNSYSFRIVYSN